MALRKISSEKDHTWALARIDELMDISEDDARFYELIYLSDIVADYEDKIFPPSRTTPAEVILFMMDQKGISRKDLEPIIGRKSMVSMILKGERNLTTAKVLPLSEFLGVPAKLLLPKVYRYEELSVVPSEVGVEVICDQPVSNIMEPGHSVKVSLPAVVKVKKGRKEVEAVSKRRARPAKSSQVRSKGSKVFKQK